MRRETSHSPAILLLVAALAVSVAMLLPATAIADEPAKGDAAKTVVVESAASHVDAANLATWERLSGPTALDTMKKIVQKGWTSSDNAVVASLEGFHDALAASSLAGELNAPVLLTPTAYLAQQTADELVRLKVKKVYIVGGVASVSAHAEEQIRLYGVTTVRVAGKDAQQTSLEVGKEVADQGSKTVIVATSAGYWDALTSGPYAYATKSPIFLTNGDGTKLLDDIIAQIKKQGANTALIAGGEGSVKPAVAQQLEDAGLTVNRLAGPNAYGTARVFANHCMQEGMGVKDLAVASGAVHQDALCGAALCGKNEAVLLLADAEHTGDAFDFLRAHNTLVHNAYILGGTASVSKDAEDLLKMATRSDAATLQARMENAEFFAEHFYSALYLEDPNDDSTIKPKDLASWKDECRKYVDPASAMYQRLGENSIYARDAATLAKNVFVTKVTDTTVSVHVDAAATQDMLVGKGWSANIANRIDLTLTFNSNNLITAMTSSLGTVATSSLSL